MSDLRDSPGGSSATVVSRVEAEGDLEPPSVPEDIASKSEVSSEARYEQSQSEDGSDAPGSQDALAAARLLLWPLLDADIVT